jgi:hypothetical protein
MSATTVQSSVGTASRRDARTFWRVLLAILAPLPLLGMGISYLLMPFDGGSTIAEMVDAMRAQPGRATAAMLAGLPFVFLIPATAALAWTTRRRRPVLTTVGACVALLGFLVAFPLLPGDDTTAWATAQENLDVATVTRLNDALWAQPVTNVAILLFLSGLVIGLPILGVAMWRSKVAPAWLAWCLILGTVTHPFIPGHTAQGIGLLVGGVGFLGVSRALLRTPNDGFDLPSM